MPNTPQEQAPNEEQSNVDGVATPTDEILALDISTDIGYGTGMLPGAPDDDVRELQHLMQDSAEENIFPTFGVDGRWGPETQAAYDNYLNDIGVECVEGPEGCVFDEKTYSEITERLIQNAEEEEQTKPASEDSQTGPSRSRFQDQCFLLTHIDHMITRDRRLQIKPYKNIHLVNTKDPATLMNKLHSTRGAIDFLEIRHWELSQLTPTVRLYKQYYQTDVKEPREIEFKFNSFVDPQRDLQEMLNSQMQRGVGIGINSFSWDLQGVQPFTSKKDIRAKLSIFAQNFNELFKERTAVDQHGVLLEGGYRIIDLVLLEARHRYITEEDGDRKNQKILVENPNFYELKAVVGWAATGGGGIISSDLSNGLKQTQSTMFLGMVDHEFKFNDDGSVHLEIEYRARIESVMLDVRSDVLSDEATRKEREKRRSIVLGAESTQSRLKQEKKPCDDRELDKLREIYRTGVEAERQRSYQFLTKQLVETGAVYTAVITQENIADAASEEPELGTGTFAENGSEITFETIQAICKDGDVNGQFSNDSNLLKEGTRYINYFYLGDLVSQALNNVLDRDEISSDIRYGKIKVILGSIEFPDPDINNKNPINVNIADIPISVELYNHFMHEKVVSKGLNSYPFLTFIRDIINNLVIEALSRYCFGETTRPRVILNTAQISADSLEGGVDPITRALEEQGGIGGDSIRKKKGEVKESDQQTESQKDVRLDIDPYIPQNDKFIFKSFNNKPMADKYNYFVVHAFSKKPKELEFNAELSEYDTRYERDFSKGIYHLTTGLDRGLVKKMSFTKTAIPGLREARLEASDFDPDLQLTNVYNANVEMFGNNLFFPGSQVYINPRGLGSDLLGDPSVKGSKANIMGLGGYFVVGTVNCQINRNGFNTTVEALFTTSGDGASSIPDDDAIVGEQILPGCSTIKDAQEALNASFSKGGR